MFKNLITYHISPLWPADLAAIEQTLAKTPFIEREILKRCKS